MKIFSKPDTVVPFQCECGISGEANVATDFHAVRCNGETIFSIACPNCGKLLEINEPDIPKHIKPYIRIEVRGWNHAD